MTRRFSSRQGYRSGPSEIVVREDAPDELRYAVPAIVYDLGLGPEWLRDVVCRVLRTRPDSNNWTPFPNIDTEVSDLVDSCLWFRVYDIIEALYQQMAADTGGRRNDLHRRFEEQVNDVFIEEGIGWHLVDGQVEVRGEEEFTASVATAIEQLDGTDRMTARREIHEALGDLSRRPEPDVTGAVQHAMAALECVARDVTGNPKATLGEILRGADSPVPAPLDQSLEKAWGYASEMGRHLREGREPTFAEAELLVGTCASAISYLVRKSKGE